jgi:N-acetylglucosamine-6-phosphate deacetylase
MTANTSRSTLLRNARIVLDKETVASANLLIADDRIVSVGDEATASSSAQVLDLRGLTLFPGFIDVHIHGAVGVDTLAADVEDLQRVGVFLAQNGVTAWLPTLVPAEENQYQQALRAISQCVGLTAGDKPSARVLGVHYEGPFVNEQQCGALHREHFRKFQTIADLDSLPAVNHPDAVHMMTLAPEVEGGLGLITELTRRGWISSIGHTKATAEMLTAAATAGACHMTHFMNAMTPLHHRTLGAVGWGLSRTDITFDIIADGIHINPQMVKLIVSCKTPERVSLISDSVSAAGLGDGQYQIWGETIAVRKGRTQNSHGSIAGSVVTMHDAVRLMLSLGFSESEIGQMSSTNPARLLRIDDECGSIAAGKRADLVALDDQRQVRLTIIGGQIAFQDFS